jgi:superfamily II DNA or RNA helicase
MKKDIRNIKASVRAQLQNKAKETNRPFSEILQYYGMERFLYRLSRSQYADRFILKGALMFTVWQVPVVVLYGGVKQRERKTILSELSLVSGKRKVILTNGTYIGEGFDNPQLDTLFITMPISFRGRVVQYAGRLHRYHRGKKDVRIYDYVDEKMQVLIRMHQKRLKTYKAMGYQIQTGGNGYDSNERCD